MLCLCVWALLTLAASTFFELDDEVLRALRYADTAACVLCFADFLNSFRRAKNKLRYMLGGAG